MSLRNERKVLEKVLKLAKELYEKYPTSLAEDQKILEDTELTFNQRNCVLFREGEKKILVFLINIAQKIIPLFDMDFKVSS